MFINYCKKYAGKNFADKVFAGVIVTSVGCISGAQIGFVKGSVDAIQTHNDYSDKEIIKTFKTISTETTTGASIGAFGGCMTAMFLLNPTITGTTIFSLGCVLVKMYTENKK
jgi:hypothetical protein